MTNHRLRSIRIAALLAALTVLVATPAAAAEQATGAVSDVTGVSVYIDKGLDDGLAVGDKVEIVRDGKVVATLEITAISSKRAVCARVGAAVPIQTGDAVRFTPKAKAPTAKTEAARKRRNAPPLAKYGIRGRIGTSYILVRQRAAGMGDYKQPAIDLRLDGTQVFGLALDANLDIRTRRTYRGLANGTTRTDNQTRVYRASVAFAKPGRPTRISIGRQFAPSLSVLSLFDGALGEYRKERWGAGVFLGTQPDPLTYGISSDVREFGGYVEFTSPQAATTRWAITSGAVSSQQNGEVNRDFVFLQTRYDNRKFTAFMTHELDVNRGWRKEAEGKSLDLTSSFAFARYRFSEKFSLNAGVDNRRNVRLYRDIETPETAFDDAFRRGYWAGVEGHVGKHVMLSLDGRRSDVNGRKPADSFTGFIAVRNLTSKSLDARVRSTRYTNQDVEGWLHSVSLSAQLTQPLRVEIHGGRRSDDTLAAGSPDTSLQWVGFEVDLMLGRRWFLMLLADRNSGSFEDNDQIFATLSYRF